MVLMESGFEGREINIAMCSLCSLAERQQPIAQVILERVELLLEHQTGVFETARAECGDRGIELALPGILLGQRATARQVAEEPFTHPCCLFCSDLA